MSDQPKKEKDLRYIGKVRTTNGKYGPMQKIYMDNLEHVNKDGSPNTFYKGALIWADAETGKNYHVRQISFFVPKDGMKKEHLDKGYTCFITLNLNDEYEVTILG